MVDHLANLEYFFQHINKTLIYALGVLRRALHTITEQSPEVLGRHLIKISPSLVYYF